MVNPRVAAIGPPLGLGLLFAAVTMACLFVGGEVFIDGWAMPGDFWFGARLADYVASGALAYVYEADARYLSLPAWPIVLAPAAALAHQMGLVFYQPDMPVPRPTAWPLLGTYTAVVTSLTFVPVRKALPAAPARGMWYLVLFGLLVYVPAAIWYGHPEDVIAIAFVVLAERARAQGNVDRAATYLGVAVGFKTAMLLAIGAFVVLVPAGRRVRALAVAAAIPLVLAAIPLAADWEHASRNLFSSHTHLDFGHRSLMFGDRGGGIDAGAFRAVGLAIGLVVGAAAARRAVSSAAGASGAWFAYALAFVPRVFTEPAVHPYYVAPVVAMVLVGVGAGPDRPRWRLLVLAAAWTAWALVPGSSLWWWLVFAAIAVALVAGLVRGQREDERRSRRYTE